MGTKIEKAKTIFNTVKEVGDTVLDAAEKIGESISKAQVQDDILYGVKRYGDDGNEVTLCSIHDKDGTWRYHKTIAKDGRTVIQYFDTMPSQEELDNMKD